MWIVQKCPSQFVASFWKNVCQSLAGRNTQYFWIATLWLVEIHDAVFREQNDNCFSNFIFTSFLSTYANGCWLTHSFFLDWDCFISALYEIKICFSILFTYFSLQLGKVAGCKKNYFLRSLGLFKKKKS